MKKTVLVLLIAMVPIVAFSRDKEHEVEHAKVISQSMNSSQAGTYNAPIGSATVAVPLYRRSNVVVVETNDYRFEWSESGNKPIVLPVNGTIDFYRDGDWFIVLDSHHKKHKFGLVGMTAKEKPPDVKK